MKCQTAPKAEIAPKVIILVGPNPIVIQMAYSSLTNENKKNIPNQIVGVAVVSSLGGACREMAIWRPQFRPY